MTASGSADVAGVTAGATAEGWVGVGVSAGGQLGMGDDGKFHVSASLGASLGLGGKLGFNITVDPKQVESTVSGVAGDIGHVANAAAGDVASGASSAMHGAENVGKAALNFVGL